MATEEDIAWFKSTFRPIPKPELPDDSVQYFVYHLPSPAPAVIDDAAETRARLLEVQRTASDLTKELLKDYIWQRESFRLEIQKDDGITSLHGRTNYGDSIEDEWVIVYILRELSKRHPDIWIKVADSDGEFLLIEAAGTLPSWLEPEVADNRVWIHQGDLRIIKPKQETTRKVTEKLSFSEARKIIQGEPSRFMKSPMIQEEAFYRLRNYPKQIADNLHSAIVTIPRKVAYLLHQKSAYISPAVEAFYIRDPIALQPLRAKDASDLTFKPDDLVTVSVRFTRVGFAQLKSQEFPAPNTWAGKLPGTENEKAYARAEAGMKLACGFEMLLYDPHHQDKAAVREMKLLLEDIETGDETLPTDGEIEKSWDKREDDEKWMDINFEDLDRELKGKGKGDTAEGGNFGDAGAQENLQRIVARFEEFLNDNSAGFDGADFIDDFDSDSDVDDDYEELSDEEEDKEASFNEEEFAKMMKEMMGMPSGSGQGPSLETPLRNRIKDLDTDEEDDTEQIHELSRQMEAELKGTGVLDLNRKQQKLTAGASSKNQTGESSNANAEEDEDDNVNINLAKNLLEALQGQAGTAGPAGNMLSMMNLRMPKDDRQ
ncbi:transcriptional regulator family: SGT1 [Penicillium waksmanii]|uniref:transcriptional regulator family: SGT1 n=1 Tax=Penicillium waksmanii TaxID=69791 RepID=UPI0025493C18|nr:transcriptional regulator family: SGT1 [Penicillium waksmanii]KAJ5989359.1 transcriptional regulator family: SGT1 [Penicillium waksmanii]